MHRVVHARGAYEYVCTLCACARARACVCACGVLISINDDRIVRLFGARTPKMNQYAVVQSSAGWFNWYM